MSKARRSRRPWPRGPIARFGIAPSVAAAGLLLVVAVGALLGVRDARAHGRSVSYSSWEIDAHGADVSLRLALLELSRLGPDALPPGSGAAESFARALTLSRGDARCEPTGAVERFDEREGWVRYAWRVACPEAPGALAIESRVLLDVSPSHLHFARVRLADAPDTVRERVLTEATPRFVLRTDGDGGGDGAPGTAGAREAVGGSRFRDYLELGVRHILSGWDHLAFLFGLMLLCDRAGALARLVTGFTLAHSLTLALTVQGLVHPRAAAVEAVIAFSVALVAIEKGWLVAGRGRAIPAAVLGGLAGLGGAAVVGASALPALAVVGLMLFTACHFALAARRDAEWTRIALTFAFGLVHGFGFAGILVELELPSERLVPALVGFNLGVELGQLAVVVLVWPLFVALDRLAAPGARRWGRDLALAGLCGLGCFWLAERALAF